MNTCILLSGGIDSTALAHLYREEIRLAITVDYGQKPAQSEIQVSQLICRELGIRHEVLTIDCSSLGSGEMAKKSVASVFAPAPEWWPYRNQLVITLVAMKAIQSKVNKLIIGTVKSDKKFIDGSKRFIKAFNKCLSMQEGSINLEAPGIDMTSTELVNHAQLPDRLLLWTHSCHISNNPCGNCNGCRKYISVMKTLGIN
jgi:7-cyano-7-deazaguanine synthase